MTSIAKPESRLTRKQEEFKGFLEREGYERIRLVNGCMWCGIRRMIFTTGLFIDLDEVCARQGRFCFETYAQAALFLKSWDGASVPTKDDGLTANKSTISGNDDGKE